MTSLNLETPKRALAIAAHPDDVEFGCGATLAKWAKAGCAIFHLICTDGSKGSWDPVIDPAAVVVRREEEQRKAARVLGGTDEVTFLRWPDGELESGLRQRAQIAAAIRRIRPDVVLGHDPWKRYRLHPDHRNAGFLVTDGVVAARDLLFFDELELPPHRPSAILSWEADEEDHAEEVASSVEEKIAALLEHRSQFRSTMHIIKYSPEADASDELEAFRERTRRALVETGQRFGVDLAEGFKLVKTDS